MANEPTITITVVRNRIPPLTDAIKAAASRAVGQTAFALERGWKARARVDTGAYRRSIQTDYRAGAMVARVFTPIITPIYPFFLEYGTRRMPAYPAAGPAAAEQAPLLTRRMDAEIDKATR